MSRILFFILFLLLGSLSAAGAVAATATSTAAIAVDPGTYLLRQGDSLMISVWREDALQKQVIVLPDGSITFPLVGRIEVAGLSTPEVERRITIKLKEFIPEPVVTVVIAGIEGNRACSTVRGPLIISEPGLFTLPIT